MTIDLSCATRWITLGFERENLARAQEFDFSAWAAEYGDGVPQLLFQRPGETTPYPVLLTVEGTTATWTPTATDTAIAGEGRAQLSFVVDETVAKNAIFAVLISPSLGTSGDPPEGFETWLEELTELAADAQAAAISAGNAETAAETAQGLAEAARDAAADYAGDAQDAAGDAQAAQRNAEAAESAAEAAEGRAAGYANSAAGSAGTAGDAATAATNAKTAAQTAQGKAEDAQAAAVSAKNAAQAAQAAIEDMTATASVADNVPGTPGVTVTKSTISGHENLDFVFSHVKGAKGDTGSQGVQGPTGPQGPRGYDGYSPTVAVTDISGGHRVTITDKNGDHPFDVMDGDVGDLDAGDVAYDDEETYPADTVGSEISSVKSALSDTAPVIVDTASGTIASFPDGTARPVVGLSVGVEPVQDLHGYANPWPGGGGKNLLNLETVTDGVRTTNVGGLTTANYAFVSEYIPVSENTDYYCNSVIPSANGYAFCFYDSAKTFLRYVAASGGGAKVANSGADAAFMLVTGLLSTKDTTIIAQSSTAVTFEPYSNICPISGWDGVSVFREAAYDAQASPVLTISWQSEAGTVYGGEVDVTAGKLTVTHVNVVLDGSANDYVTKYQEGANGTADWLHVQAVTVDSLVSIGNVSGQSISSFLPYTFANANGTPHYYKSGTVNIFLPTASYASVDAVKTWLAANPQSVWLPLKEANYLEFELTAAQLETLLGQNNVWATTGDVAVSYRADTKLFIDKMDSGKVSDVQVNGQSVVTNGVANVPLSTDTVPGVVMGDGYYGVETIKTGTAKGKLQIVVPTDAQVKAGANGYRPITPSKQHQSTFYGLAKAAGDTTQKDSSNAVGTYTESAKSAINSMLNAPETVSGSTPTIAAKAGVRYVCGEVSTLTVTLPASGIVDVIFQSGSTPTVLTVTPPTGMTMSWAGGFDPTALEADTTYEINIADGCLGVAGSWT